MKFTCSTADLNKAVQTVMNAIPSKPSTPIFGGIHILANEGIIELQGMDINMSMSCKFKAEVEERGELVLTANRFAELVKSMNGETVVVSRNEAENTVSLKSGKANFKILIMNSNDYPKFPDFNPDKTFVIPDEKIKELIKKTAFACSNDVARPLFTGVLCDIADGKVTFVGTNTHRLAIKSLEYASDDKLSIIIPSTVLKEINKNLNGKLPQDVKFSILSNQIMVVIDNVVIVSRLIEGKFPDYKRVIPPSFTVKTQVNVKELAGAVQRMSLCSGDETDYSIIKIKIDDKELTVMSSSPDVGTGEEKIACATQGERLNVAFNATYILDIMNNIEEDEAILQLNNSLSPVCVTPVKEKDYTYIVTPVRVIF
jgi:DNA polymerase-3 subunit beta